jgi:hypothetical protein
MYGRSVGRASLGCRALENLRSFCSVYKVTERKVYSIVIRCNVTITDLDQSRLIHRLSKTGTCLRTVTSLSLQSLNNAADGIKDSDTTPATTSSRASMS